MSSEPVFYLIVYFIVMYIVIARAVQAGTSTPLVARHLHAQTELLLRIARQQGVPEPELAEIADSIEPRRKPVHRPPAAPTS
jgi:hypothetical protein